MKRPTNSAVAQDSACRVGTPADAATPSKPPTRSTKFFLAVAALALALVLPSSAQPRAGRGGPPPDPKASAAIDMTGYWVSVVTEDWKFRMVIGRKGNFGGVPLNAAARKVAMMWEPPKDQFSPLACSYYGAAALMRIPGRLHITWADDTTLKIETDAGAQTRLFHFNATRPASAAPSLQGYSVANWEYAAAGRGQPRKGDLKVLTTNLSPGYLRTNGVPYSGNAALTEYYDRLQAPNGDDWLVVTTVVTDPEYLTMPFVTSTHFKKLPDAQGWDPQPCVGK